MPLIDFDKLAKQYDDVDDFGFSAVSEEEYNSLKGKYKLDSNCDSEILLRIILEKKNIKKYHFFCDHFIFISLFY